MSFSDLSFFMFNTLLLLPPEWQLIIIVILSACVGSFLNVVVYRLSVKHGFVEWEKGKPYPSLIWSRSFCPHCQHAIAWYDNIPLVSYLLLRGRCRHCHQAISWQYPAVELATALISGLLYFVIGPKAYLLAAILLCWWLIPMLILDLKFFILPDELTLSLLVTALGLNYFNIVTTFKSAIIGAIVGYLILAILDRLYYWYRKRHGIGQGDWKLLAALGAFFGWQVIFNVLTIAAAVGAVCGILLMVMKRADLQTRLPFGVFLALAALAQILLDTLK